MALPARAALETGVFDTVPTAKAEERGEYLPFQIRDMSRIVPLSASLSFDLTGLEPTVTATIFVTTQVGIEAKKR